MRQSIHYSRRSARVTHFMVDDIGYYNPSVKRLKNVHVPQEDKVVQWRRVTDDDHRFPAPLAARNSSSNSCSEGPSKTPCRLSTPSASYRLSPSSVAN